MSRTEAISCVPQIITLRGCEEKNGRSKVTPDASTVAAVVGEKAHLGMKQR